jgi:hypothetical protein
MVQELFTIIIGALVITMGYWISILKAHLKITTTQLDTSRAMYRLAVYQRVKDLYTSHPESELVSKGFCYCFDNLGYYLTERTFPELYYAKSKVESSDIPEPYFWYPEGEAGRSLRIKVLEIAIEEARDQT